MAHCNYSFKVGLLCQFSNSKIVKKNIRSTSSRRIALQHVLSWSFFAIYFDCICIVASWSKCENIVSLCIFQVASPLIDLINRHAHSLKYLCSAIQHELLDILGNGSNLQGKTYCCPWTWPFYCALRQHWQIGSIYLLNNQSIYLSTIYPSIRPSI